MSVGGIGGVFHDLGVLFEVRSDALDQPTSRQAARDLREGFKKVGNGITEFGENIGGPLGKWVSGFGKKITGSVTPSFKERCKTFFGAVGWSMLGVLAIAGTVTISPLLFIFVAIPAAISMKRAGLLVIPLFPIVIAPGYCFLSAFNKDLRDDLVKKW